MQCLTASQSLHNFSIIGNTLQTITANINSLISTADLSVHATYYTTLQHNFCGDCIKKMAALPQGAFAACKLREHYSERNFFVSLIRSGDSTGGANSDNKNADTKNLNTNKKLLEYSPVKYNGKLMNSIWGLYNRYSPHNIKGNEYDDKRSSSFAQQHSAVVASTIANDMAMGLCTGKK